MYSQRAFETEMMTQTYATGQAVELRKIGTNDLDRIVLIERRCFESPWSRRQFEHEINLDCSIAFAAVRRPDDNAEIIGYICAWIVRDECTVNKIACTPSRQRTGIGSRLLHHMMQHAGNSGAGVIHLETCESNAAAQCFYGKHGFIQVGRRRAYYPGNVEHAVLMSAATPVSHEG